MFVMGLHRSGTTWLYEMLGDLFPLAPLSAHALDRRADHSRAHDAADGLAGPGLEQHAR